VPDTNTLTLLSLAIHVPLVTAWIGFVMWDVFASTAPSLNGEQRGRMIVWSRPFVVLAIVVILVTGIWQTIHNPLGPDVTSWSTLQELKAKTYGYALFWKHGFVLATFILTILVRFVLAPRLTAEAAAGGASAPTVTLRRTILWLSVLNLLACLGALVMATRMVWELH
jgi:hypothetical protein